MTAPLGIVLAAGEGRRMGGPKALLLVDGQPLIALHVQRLRDAGCQPIVIVVPPAIAEPVHELLRSVSEAQVCPVDSAAMSTSLSAALTCVSPRLHRAVVVTPVDALPARASTLDALLRATLEPDVQVATPRYQARGGHPIVARERLLQPFRSGFSGTLRDVLHGAEAQRRRVDVDDPNVLSDLDTPADLAARRPGLVPRFAGGAPAPHVGRAGLGGR